jgi:hypothetical protein
MTRARNGRPVTERQTNDHHEKQQIERANLIRELGMAPEDDGPEGRYAMTTGEFRREVRAQREARDDMALLVEWADGGY